MRPPPTVRYQSFAVVQIWHPLQVCPSLRLWAAHRSTSLRRWLSQGGSDGIASATDLRATPPHRRHRVAQPEMPCVDFYVHRDNENVAAGTPGAIDNCPTTSSTPNRALHRSPPLCVQRRQMSCRHFARTEFATLRQRSARRLRSPELTRCFLGPPRTSDGVLPATIAFADPDAGLLHALAMAEAEYGSARPAGRRA